MTKPIAHNPHDKIFKDAMQYPEVFKEFLTMHLPQNMQKIIDWQDIKYCNVSFINKKFKLLESDVLLKTKLLKKEGHCYIYVLAEHQSKAETFMPLRLIEYMINIWNYARKEQQNKLPLPVIFPLIFFTGQGNYNKPLTIWDLCGSQASLMQNIWSSPFTLVNVNNIPPEQLKAKPWAGTLSFLMSNYFKQRIDDGLKFIADNLNYLATQPNSNFVIQLLRYITINDKEHRNIKEFAIILENKLSPALEEKIMNLAERIEAEGFEKGIEKGIEKGMEKGKEQEKIENAKNFLKEGVEPTIIARATGLQLSKIKELQKEIPS